MYVICGEMTGTDGGKPVEIWGICRPSDHGLKKTDEKIKLYLIFMAWHVNILNTDDT